MCVRVCHSTLVLGFSKLSPIHPSTVSLLFQFDPESSSIPHSPSASLLHNPAGFTFSIIHTKYTWSPLYKLKIKTQLLDTIHILSNRMHLLCSCMIKYHFIYHCTFKLHVIKIIPVLFEAISNKLIFLELEGSIAGAPWDRMKPHNDLETWVCIFNTWTQWNPHSVLLPTCAGDSSIHPTMWVWFSPVLFLPHVFGLKARAKATVLYEYIRIKRRSKERTQ